jgi:transcriptional regulator with PAS, ATPase and Fis domain
LIHDLVVASIPMRNLLRVAERVASSAAPILLRGAAGTGKELIARAIHKWSEQRGAAFQKIHCSTLSSPIELVGGVAGSVSGLDRDRQGKLAMADGGTLFLDEIGDLEMSLQAQLLRVLEDRSYVPMGGHTPKWTSVRVIASTRVPLERLVASGRLREDLMYRVQVVPLDVPGLSQRCGDIDALTQHFIDRMNAGGGRQIEAVSDDAMALLNSHPWPGNVRELHNLIEYAFAVGEGTLLTASELTPIHSAAAANSPVRAGVTLVDLDRRRLLAALDESGGRRSQAAEILGISRTTLWRKLRSHNMV